MRDTEEAPATRNDSKETETWVDTVRMFVPTLVYLAILLGAIYLERVYS